MCALPTRSKARRPTCAAALFNRASPPASHCWQYCTRRSRRGADARRSSTASAAPTMARHLLEGSLTRRATRGRKICRAGEKATKGWQRRVGLECDVAAQGQVRGTPASTSAAHRPAAREQATALASAPRKGSAHAHHLCPLRHQRFRELGQHHGQHVQRRLPAALVLVAAGRQARGEGGARTCLAPAPAQSTHGAARACMCCAAQHTHTRTGTHSAARAVPADVDARTSAVPPSPLTPR